MTKRSIDDVYYQQSIEHSCVFDTLPAEIIFNILKNYMDCSSDDSSLIMLAKMCPRVELLLLDHVKKTKKTWNITCECFIEIVKDCNLSCRLLSDTSRMYVKYNLLEHPQNLINDSKLIIFFENKFLNLINYCSFKNKTKFEIKCDHLVLERIGRRHLQCNDFVANCTCVLDFVFSNFNKVKKIQCEFSSNEKLLEKIFVFINLEDICLVGFNEHYFIKCRAILQLVTFHQYEDLHKFNKNFQLTPTIDILIIYCDKRRQPQTPTDSINILNAHIKKVLVIFKFEIIHDCEIKIREFVDTKIIPIFNRFLHNSSNSIKEIEIQLINPNYKDADIIYSNLKKYLDYFKNLESLTVEDYDYKKSAQIYYIF